MIRLNLLVDAREAGIATRRVVPVRLLCGCAVVAAGIGVAAWEYRTLAIAEATLSAAPAQQRLESSEDPTPARSVAAVERERAELMARIAWLEEQRRDRAAVVQLLAHIGHSVPRDVWLTVLSREEEMVSMAGLSVTHRAVAELLANLESGGLFVGPVDLIDSDLRLAPAAEADAGPGLIEFSIPGAAGEARW